jgi:DNA-binding CsgD family transcriptional regulator
MSFSNWAVVSARIHSRPDRLRRAVRPVLALAAVAVAALLFLLMEGRLIDLTLSQAAARAVDQAQLGVVNQLTVEDFAPPFDTARLEHVDAALAPLLRRVHQPGSGILRVNVFARDGTLLDSDEPALRGHRIETDDTPMLAAALHGDVVAERSTLQGPENMDLRSRVSGALEVYVPLTREGEVVGAYEVYLDLGGAQTMRTVLWIVFAGAMTVVAWLATSRVLPRPHDTQLPQQNGPQPQPTARGLKPRHPTEPGADIIVAESGSHNNEARLSPRELEVLQLLVSSHTYRDIASALTISEETVRTHVKRILRKLDQPDRTQAVVAAVRSGLIRLP